MASTVLISTSTAISSSSVKPRARRASALGPVVDVIVVALQPVRSVRVEVVPIGIVLARIIYTEILDIAYFKEPKYLVSYSGLAPIENESAGRKGPIILNRYCNYYLKYAFVEAAHNSSDFKKHTRKYELDIKKHGKIIAKVNLARRIVKAVYWMLTHQQSYKM